MGTPGTSAYPRIRAALPVGPVPPPPDDPDARPVGDAAELTRDLLTRAAQQVGPQARVTGFRRWWDGDAWVPLLAVRIAGRPAWLVESGGEVHVLPARQRLARRLLRRSRPTPGGAPLAPPRARASGSIAVGAPTRPGVEVFRGALSPRQARERAEARRRGLARPGADDPGQLGLFDSDLDDTATVEPTPPSPPTATERLRLPLARRRPAPPPPPVRVVQVIQGGDVLRCGRSGCGALVPLPPPGTDAPEPPVCPLCSRM